MLCVSVYKKMRNMNASRLLIGSLVTLAIGCSAPPQDTAELDRLGAVESALTSAEFAQFLRGRDLFRNETFGGNGRTCETCHIRDAFTDNFDFTPADAQAIFAADPTDPLFRPIDS